ncbi:MAG: divalent-cation tolerance protein CutA [Vulcanimicrobiota bacterium]
MAGKLEVTEENEALVALITVPGEHAEKLSSALLESRSAACVNVIEGLTSVYRWKGEICRDPETLLVVKTTSEKRQAVAEVLTAHHPYEEPELIFLPIQSGSRSYLAWLKEMVR